MDTNNVTFHCKGDRINSILTAINILPEECFFGLSKDKLEARMQSGIVEVFPAKGSKAREINLENIGDNMLNHEDGSKSFSLSMTVGKIGYAIGSPFQYRLYLEYPDKD